MFLSFGIRNITKRCCVSLTLPVVLSIWSSAQMVPAGERSRTAPSALFLRSASSCFLDAPGGNGCPIELRTRLCVFLSNAYHRSGVAPS